eukprot:9522482-Lingulodinium_polyedra.AAC.1
MVGLVWFVARALCPPSQLGALCLSRCVRRPLPGPRSFCVLVNGQVAGVVLRLLWVPVACCTPPPVDL